PYRLQRVAHGSVPTGLAGPHVYVPPGRADRQPRLARTRVCRLRRPPAYPGRRAPRPDNAASWPRVAGDTRGYAPPAHAAALRRLLPTTGRPPGRGSACPGPPVPLPAGTASSPRVGAGARVYRPLMPGGIVLSPRSPT